MKKINPSLWYLLSACILSLWAWGIHSHNLSYFPQQAYIYTADDASYTAPAENYLTTGIWKDNSLGKSSYVQRPPGMGLIHLLCLYMGGTYAWLLQKILVFMLHFTALYLLAKTVQAFGGFRWGFIALWVYGLLPCFWGYLSYLITESVTLSLVILLLFAYTRYFLQKKHHYLFMQAVLVAFILLIRPQLMVVAVPFIYALILYGFSKPMVTWGTPFICLLLAFGGYGIWQARVVQIMGRWPGLHPIYDVSNTSLYRPIHQSIGELFKVWEHNSQRFHTTIGNIWEQAGKAEDKDHFYHIHTQNCKGITSTQLHAILHQYEAVLRHQQLLPPTIIQQGELPQEKLLRLKVDSITRVLKQQNFVLYHLKTPLRSAGFLLSKSQLNLYMFQTTYRGLWWMEALRYLSLFTVLVTIFGGILIYPYRKQPHLWLLSAGMLFYMFYLFYFQRMNEERYMLPMLPVGFVLSIYFLHTVVQKIFSLRKPL